MKPAPATFSKGTVAAVAAVALLAAAAITVKTMSVPTVPAAQEAQIIAKSPDETVASIADGMNRSDADGVLSYVDTNVVFSGILRSILEGDRGQKMEDKEFDAFMLKNGSFLWQSRDALSIGIKTQSHKDGATPGSVLYALVHISEGTVEPRGDERFAVLYADGTSLEFARRGGAWKAEVFDGFSQYLAGYRTQAEEQIRSGKPPAGQRDVGSSVNAPSGR